MKLYIATKATPPFGRKGSRSSWDRPTQKIQVYDCIVDAGANGITRKLIAEKCGLRADRISFYLSELRRQGYISVKGDPSVPNALMSADEAKFATLLALENALVCIARESGITEEMNRSYAKYQKIKELALRPGTGPEGQTALRLAVLELVKVTF